MNYLVKQPTSKQSFPKIKQLRQRKMKFFIKHAIKLVPRILTNQIRVMPDCLIIGATKCGTSSLYYYLKQHPCFAPPLRKEIYFFDLTYRRGPAWYRAFFPTVLEKNYYKKYKGDFITGETTPCYIFHPHAPERVFKAIPGVKLIVLLRNPIDRAYSFYHMQFRRGIEDLSFEESIEVEEERLQGEIEKMLVDGNYFSHNRQNYSYLSGGIYIDQIKNWLRFFPKEQILVLESKQLFTDPSRNLKRVLEFLNLQIWEPKVYQKLHSGSYPKMDETTRNHLVKYFKPFNQRLYDFLGMDFNWDR